AENVSERESYSGETRVCGRGWTDVRREAPASGFWTFDVEYALAEASDFVLQPRPLNSLLHE
ncbi:MAG: hypothetical protein KDA86_19235, partial [Planctomycetaceae bacterium]|nr:hypothetical protein [Planctomycetaceae bacterium]